VDRWFITGQEAPSLFGSGTLVTIQVIRLLGTRQLGCLARVEADRQHLELATGVEFKHAENARQAVQGQRAEHGAFVVDECDDRRLPVQEIAQAHRIAVFVAEHRVEWDRFAQVLIESDFS
jgi:hypothetical protein